jgi:hypothetical protein
VVKPILSLPKKELSAFGKALISALESGNGNFTPTKNNFNLDPLSRGSDEISQQPTELIKSCQTDPTKRATNIVKKESQLLSKREKAKIRKDSKRADKISPDKTIIKELEYSLKNLRDKNSKLSSYIITLQQSQEIIEGGKRHLEIREILRKAIAEASAQKEINKKLQQENLKLRQLVEKLTFKLHNTSGDNIYYGGHYSEADS